MERHSYTSDPTCASPDPHEGCEERVRFLAEQCAELLRDLERMKARRDFVLRQLITIRTDTWGRVA